MCGFWYICILLWSQTLMVNGQNWLFEIFHQSRSVESPDTIRQCYFKICVYFCGFFFVCFCFFVVVFFNQRSFSIYGQITSQLGETAVKKINIQLNSQNQHMIQAIYYVYIYIYTYTYIYDAAHWFPGRYPVNKLFTRHLPPANKSVWQVTEKERDY